MIGRRALRKIRARFGSVKEFVGIIVLLAFLALAVVLLYELTQSASR